MISEEHKWVALSWLCIFTVLMFGEVAVGQDFDESLLKAIGRTTEVSGDSGVKSAAPQYNPYEPYRTGGGHLIEIGSYRIDNIWQGKERKKGIFVADDWRHFMHGVKDAAAYPLAWEQFVDEKQAKFLDKGTTLETEVKFSNVPPIRLKGGESLIPSKPLLDLEKLAQFRGASLRFFIWIKGEGTGKGVALWDGAPSVTFYLKDSQGTLVETYPGLFNTRGSFPWFCYYVDVKIPYGLSTGSAAATTTTAEASNEGTDNSLASWAQLIGFNTMEDDNAIVTDEVKLPAAGGLYVELENPVSGTAWFSTISFGQYANGKLPPREMLADPTTGSLAPNPDYDELPMHIYFGLANLRKWNFLKGNNSFGDLTKVEGLKAFLARAEKDWSYMLHAVPYLVSMYNVGIQQEQASEFEKGWLEMLGAWLESMRDESTGLWKLNGRSSLELTEAVMGNCYSPVDMARSDEVSNQTEWLSIGGKTVTDAAKMVDAILAVQERDPRNPDILAGWTRYAFQPNALKKSDPVKRAFELCSTNAAVSILNQCLPQVNDAMKRQIRNSVKAAWDYGMRTVFRNDGKWYQSDAIQQLDGPAFALDFLDGTQWLESRFVSAMAAPKLKVDFGSNGSVKVTWLEPADNAVSVRIYALPKDAEGTELPVKQLAGVIQKTSKGLKGMDPLLAAKQICDAGKDAWGITPEMAGADYIAKKMSDLAPRLKVSKGLDLQVTKPMDLADVSWWAVAVSPYGEMSKPVQLAEKTDEN